MNTVFAYVLFAYWCLPIFIFLLHYNSRFKLEAATILSLTMTFAVIGYELLYFIIRILTESISFGIISMYTIPVILIFILVRHAGVRTIYTALQDFNSHFTLQKIKAPLLVLGLYAMVASIYLFKNGIDENGNLIAYNLFGTEVINHLSLVSQLDYNIFPRSLQFITADNSFYHYFSNLFIHIMSKSAAHPNNFILFVYFFVPLLLFMLTVSVYALTKEIWKSRRIAWISVVLSLLVYDTSALVLWIRGFVYDRSLLFGANLPEILSVWTPIITQFQLFHNPSYLFSTVLFLGTLVLTKIYFEMEIPSKTFYAFTVLSWVFLIKAKITAFLVGLAGLSVLALLKIIFKKDKRGLTLLAGVFLLSIPFLFMAVGQGANGIIFSNWFFPANFAKRWHFINDRAWTEIKESGFLAGTKDLFMFSLAFISYYAGLMGLRMAFFFRKYNFMSFKLLWTEPGIHMMLISMIGAGFTAFVLFSASVSKHDTMWFYLLILFLLNLYTAERLNALYESKRKGIWIVKGLVFSLIFFSTLSFVIPALQEPHNKVVISQDMMVSYSLIKGSPNDEKRTLSQYHFSVRDKDEQNFQLSAFTGKKVVSEGLDYTVEFRLKDPQRQEAINEVRQDIAAFYKTASCDTAISLIKKYNVGFIYLISPDTFAFDHKAFLTEVYCGETIRLYREK